MNALPELKAPKGFNYSTAPQRTPAWHELRIGKRTASRLEDWLAVSKATKTLGKPLKKRLDYEKELVYETLFGVSYNNYMSEAMYDGVNLEKYAIEQYSQIKGVTVEEVGAWFNEYFVASPDGAVGEDGLVETKIVRDNTFSDILSGGVPDKWWKQCQGQLWASGRKWCDFIAVNINTKKIAIIRVEPDAEFHEWLEIAIPEEFTITPEVFNTEIVHDLVGPLPEITAPSSDNEQYFN